MTPDPDAHAIISTISLDHHIVFEREADDAGGLHDFTVSIMWQRGAPADADLLGLVSFSNAEALKLASWLFPQAHRNT